MGCKQIIQKRYKCNFTNSFEFITNSLKCKIVMNFHESVLEITLGSKIVNWSG